MPLKHSDRDYVDRRFLEAPGKAAEILVEHAGEWHNEIDAYWLLRKHEDEVGVPITYDIVVEAMEIARRRLEAVRKPATLAEAEN